MWKASAGHAVQKDSAATGADDWDTDPDFVNDVSEKEQRWGAKTVEGSGHVGSMSMAALREQVQTEDKTVKQKQYEAGPKGSHGYGGQFGVEKEKMDKSAVGHDYQAPKALHASQTDAAKGFGGKFGVQGDRKDKSAGGWEHHEKVEKHASQTDAAGGYGGKYGVQAERVDKSAVGWDYKGQTDKHQSQTDASRGFGGKFGVQTDLVDKSAKGYGEQTAPGLHSSQTDHKKGFGGKFGVEADRVDKSAHGYGGPGSATSISTDYQKTKPVVTGSEGAGKLKAKFEGLAAAGRESQEGGGGEHRGRAEGHKKVEQEQERPQATEQGGQNEVEDDASAAVSGPEEEGVAEGTGGEEDPEELYQDTRVASDKREPAEGVDDDEAMYSNIDDLADPVEPSTDAVHDAPSGGNDEIHTGDAGRGKVAVAIYDYQASGEDELTFDPEEEITNIEFVDDDWWRGNCRGINGLFPANYVQLKED